MSGINKMFRSIRLSTQRFIKFRNRPKQRTSYSDVMPGLTVILNRNAHTSYSMEMVSPAFVTFSQSSGLN